MAERRPGRQRKQALLMAAASMIVTGAVGANVDAVEAQQRPPRRGREDGSTTAKEKAASRMRVESDGEGGGSARHRRMPAAAAAVEEGRDAMRNVLTERIFAGTELRPEERKLGVGGAVAKKDSPLSIDGDNVLSERELTQFYWRQLSVSYHNKVPAPAPAPKKDGKSPDTSVTCDAYAGDGGSGNGGDGVGGTGSSGDGGCYGETVEVTFTYQAETKGYVDEDDLALVDHVVINDVAHELCEDDRRALLEEKLLLEEIEGGGGEPTATSSSAWSTERRGLPNVLSVGDKHFATPTARDPPKRKTRQQQRRKLEIVCVEVSDATESTGYCKTTHPDATTCREYEVTLTVTYNKEGEENTSAEEVKQNVLNTIEYGMGKGDYVSKIHDDMAEDEWENIFENGKIVRLNYVEDDDRNVAFSTAQEAQAIEDDEPNKTAIAMGILAALAVLAALILFLYRRSRRRNNEEGGEEFKSVNTTDLGDVDDASYVSADYNDLGARHTCQNVHQCKSSLCRNCKPPSAISAVQEQPMVASSGDDESDLIQELARKRDRDVVFVRTHGSRVVDDGFLDEFELEGDQQGGPSSLDLDEEPSARGAGVNGEDIVIL